MKEFNITGICVPEVHYMVDISNKIEKIAKMVEKGAYFTINRARQYGKTTTLFQLFKYLKAKYIVIKISFEGIGDVPFEKEDKFCKTFTDMVSDKLRKSSVNESIITLWNKESLVMDDLSKKITALTQNTEKEIILMIDEVDKSSNNQLFLNFIGMLRNKYLMRQEGNDSTFKSVILAGVYDIKNLKLKIRPDTEKEYNSPWNIASDFDIDMSFNPEEISTMLTDYEKENKTGMDISFISNEIYNYTQGYPFLVSKLCKLIDEKLDKNWSITGIKDAVNIILGERNTLFDDLIKNLENNKDLYDILNNILVEGRKINFNIDNPSINLGTIFAILDRKNNETIVSNKIFEVRIYNYIISKRETSGKDNFIYDSMNQFRSGNKLNMEVVLNKFQEIMHDEYRDKDTKFIEREGRLLFLCFLKPIINGKGFYYIEPETRHDSRMDIVITYGDEEFVIELKIKRKESTVDDAIKQLAGYLESKRLIKGYLVTFSFLKNKEYDQNHIKYEDKNIYSITV